MYHGNIYRVFFIFDEGRIVVYGVDLSTLNKKQDALIISASCFLSR